MKAIVNTKLLLENGISWDGVLLYEGDRIVARGPAEEVEVPEGAETCLLYTSGCFLRSPLEQEVYKQFSPFIARMGGSVLSL